MDLQGWKQGGRQNRLAGLFTVGLVLALSYAFAAGRQTQAEMNHTAQLDYARADVQLNKAYQQLKAALNAKEQAKLKKAEMAWLNFRDAESDFRASKVEGGTIYPMVKAGYLKEMTQRRTQELKDALKAFKTEGNL